MKQENLIGKEVVVYCRYLFAVPVKGRIIEVAELDGAFSVKFHGTNPGGSNVTKHNGKYFHHEQCKVIEISPSPEEVRDGYYKTGERMPWLQTIVDEFDPTTAKRLADYWNLHLSGVTDNIEIECETLLAFVTNTLALLAINKNQLAACNEWVECAKAEGVADIDCPSEIGVMMQKAWALTSLVVEADQKRNKK